MNSNLLPELLKEYDIKRRNASDNLLEFKKKLYASNHRLSEIEDELNSVSLNTLKSILNTPKEQEKYVELLNNRINELKNERKEILLSLNLTEACLEPNYDCKVCNDTGYLKNGSMCNCLKQNLINLSYTTSNLNKLDKENFDNFDLNKYSDEVNVDKYKFNVSPRANIENILNICKSFIDNFDDDKTKNLLFIGNTGLGKTFISSCIANEILKKNKTVLYQTAPIMFDTIIDYRFGKNDGSIYKSILSVDLLIIDDLGTETINNMKYAELFTIINSRLLSENTKTIISTNFDIKELFNRYDERMVSRFVQNYNICKFFGDDIRLMSKK